MVLDYILRIREMGARTVKNVGKREPIAYRIREKTYHKTTREGRPRVKVVIYNKYKKMMSQWSPVESSGESTADSP